MSEAVRRERDAPIYVCQRCGRLGRDGWIATYYESVFDGPLRGMKCPTCDCPDLEKNTAKELAALCTRLQAALVAERERVTGLEGELMHRDKQLQHVCVTLEAVSTQLDAERIRRGQEATVSEAQRMKEQQVQYATQDALSDAQREVRRLREALESIAKNTCCDRCQEAALVAHAALSAGGTRHG